MTRKCVLGRVREGCSPSLALRWSGSAKLEEFVNGLDKQVKNGPSLTEALENAGIFYEAQYKEVKVVANVSND